MTEKVLLLVRSLIADVGLGFIFVHVVNVSNGKVSATNFDHYLNDWQAFVFLFLVVGELFRRAILSEKVKIFLRKSPLYIAIGGLLFSFVAVFSEKGFLGFFTIDSLLLFIFVGWVVHYFFAGSASSDAPRHEDNKFSDHASDASIRKNQPQRVSEVGKEKQKPSLIRKLATGTAIAGAVNIYNPPVVIPRNGGGVVRAVVPKGLSWEVHYSVPGDDRVHKNKVTRGTSGMTHGPVSFEIRWP
jgi:hypothetical protein